VSEPTPTPVLKEYVEDAKKEARIFKATYPCPVCDSEDGLMQAAGQWLLGTKKRAEKTRILQYKCQKCGATLRIAEKEQKGANPIGNNAEQGAIRPNQT
jgi:hypothetical protein